MRGAINFDGPHWDNVIQTLLHSLWQGAFISLILLVLLRTFSVRRPELRYGVSCVALVLTVCALAVTFALLEFRDSLPVPATEGLGSGVETPQVESPTEPGVRSSALSIAATASLRPSTVDRLRYIPALWLAGVAAMLFRALRLQWQAARMPSSGMLVKDPTVIRMVREVARTLGVSRSVSVLSTTALNTPAVLGWLYPVILLPAACIAGVPDTVLRAAIAHELAHIRRHDFLINQIQILVEAFLFFNPAVWWISHQVRVEREAACDAIAARAVGDEVDYAKSLAAWASFGHGPVYVMAATGQQRGSVLERVRRLLDARYTPALMRSWAGAVVLSLAGLGILAAFTGGSYWGVFILARVLTPAERIAVLEEVTAKHGGAVVRSTDFDAHNLAIPLRVRVVAADGRAVPESTTVTGSVLYEDGNSSSLTSFEMLRIGGDSGVAGNGTLFEGKASRGIGKLRAIAPGYATAFSSPIAFSEAAPPDEIVMKLTSGFATGLRLTGRDGAALSKVNIVGGYFVSDEWSTVSLVSDDEGIVRVEHCADAPLKWQIDTPGYEHEIRVIEHQADSIEEWELTAALLTTGLVLDEKSGNPLAEARIYEVAREGGPNPGSYSEVDAFPLIAKSDQQGRFALSSLRRDTRYRVMVESGEGGRAFFEGVRAGDENLEFKLPTELSIRGRVSGALSRLPQMEGKPVLVIYTTFKIGDSSFHSQGEQVPLEVVGESATFVLEGLWRGKFQIELPDSRMDFELAESRHDLDLVIPEASETLTRDVILRFKGTNDAPPKGALYVNGYELLGGKPLDLTGPLALEGDTLSLTVLVPSVLSLSPDGMVGYGFDPCNKEISAGEGAYLVELDTWPAGSIEATVVDRSKGEKRWPLLSLVELTPAPSQVNRPYRHRPDVRSVSDTEESVARFRATPVPLGGTYRLVASQGWNHVFSDEIELNDRSPVAMLELVMPEGISFRGRVLSEGGEPLRGAQINLSMDMDGGGSYGGDDGIISGRDGNFEITPVNPDFIGTYSLEVNGLQNFQAVRIAEVDVSDFLEIRMVEGMSFSGSVTGPDGSPAPYVTVRASPHGVASYNIGSEKTVSDGMGNFEFTNLAGTLYTFNARGSGEDYWSVYSEVVDLNETQYIDLRGR